MFAYTDYPLVENQAKGPVAVTVLAYDRNLYCTVQYAGHTYEVKSGYIYRDEAGTKSLRLIDLYSLPRDVGAAKPSRREVFEELRAKRTYTRSFILHTYTEADEREVTKHSTLKGAIKKMAAAIATNKCKQAYLSAELHKPSYFSLSTWVEFDGTCLFDYCDRKGPRAAVLPRPHYLQLHNAVIARNAVVG